MGIYIRERGGDHNYTGDLTLTEERYEKARGKGRLKTAYGIDSHEVNFYDLLQGKKDGNVDETLPKYYPGGTGSKGQIFTTAVLLGWLHNKRSDQRANDEFLRFSDVTDDAPKAILRMIFLEICNDPENKDLDEKVIFNEFCRYADGGIEILMENYQKNGNKIDMKEISDDIDKQINEKSATIQNALGIGTNN